MFNSDLEGCTSSLKDGETKVKNQWLPRCLGKVFKNALSSHSLDSVGIGGVTAGSRTEEGCGQDSARSLPVPAVTYIIPLFPSPLHTLSFN